MDMRSGRELARENEGGGDDAEPSRGDTSARSIRFWPQQHDGNEAQER
ncbi:MAG: hypothetical protein ACREQF_05180 [Candidatus Binataceae bacterium]